MKSQFKIIARDGKARAGILQTGHGEIKTPVFMPVGTQASVKTLSPDDLKSCGAQIILGNTYHLYLRPGSDVIRKMGGLHKFMDWDYPILTDSGGFQAFSLGAMIGHGVRKVPHAQVHVSKVYKSPKIYGEKNKKIIRHVTEVIDKENPSTHSTELRAVKLRTSQESEVKNQGGVELAFGGQFENPERAVLAKMSEEGVEFTSHLDGSKHLLTPEKSVEVQLDLGSDIALVLDELLSPLHDRKYAKDSLERTHRWELRSKEYFDKNLKDGVTPKAQLFGILQGVYDKEIREREAQWIEKQGFSGVSIGGSFGTSEFYGEEETNWAAAKSIYQTMEWVVPIMSEELPKHALGIGEVQDFFECIERGIDMFDCVAPTRRARNGSLYISPKNGGNAGNKFTLSIQRAQYILDSESIDPGCECYTCTNFTRSYLRHLYISGEMLYHRLASIHNVYFMTHLVNTIRESICDNQFKKLKAKWL